MSYTGINEVNRFAEREGWALFECDGTLEIQRDDEMAVFVDDDAALAHVQRLADAGSALHSAALGLRGMAP